MQAVTHTTTWHVLSNLSYDEDAIFTTPHGTKAHALRSCAVANAEMNRFGLHYRVVALTDYPASAIQAERLAAEREEEDHDAHR